MANWSYVITHYDASGANVITNDVISIPKFTDTGSGEVNEATIVLNAVNGQFIKASINSKTEIKQFDRIRIFVNDGLGTGGTQGGAYDKIFFVMKKQPIKSKDAGVRLQLELLGIESFLQRVMYSKPSYFEKPFDVFKDICDLYESSRGTNSASIMPELIDYDNDTYNQLPQNIVNSYDYGINEDTCFDRMSDLIDSMGSSFAAGGVLDFFDLRFSYINNGTQIRPRVFSSGNEYANGTIGGQTIVTIDNSTAVNVGETDGGINSKTGTQVLAWGAADSGSLPTDFSKFTARQQWWNLFFPDFVSGSSYGSESKVSHVVSGVRNNYKSNISNNTSTPPTNWTLQTPAVYYGDDYQYSPWTSGKATSVFRNSAADPTASYGLSGGTCPMFFDHNIVINDGYFWRTTADAKSTSDEIGATHGSQIPEECLYDSYSGGTRNGTGDAFYRGFRVLCVGNPTANGGTYFGYSGSAATVKDDNGKLIANSVLQYDGTKWMVYARPYKDHFLSPGATLTGGGTNDPIGLQCVVFHEGKTYQFNKAGTSAWDDKTNEDMGNDSLHPVDLISGSYKITNIPGVLANYGDDKDNPKDVDSTTGPYRSDPWSGSPKAVNADSAVEVQYTWDPGAIAAIDTLGRDFLANRTGKDFYQCGAWLSLRFPLPTTAFNSISESVGDLYGGGTNQDNPREPSTLDVQNMHLTHDGERGFNQDTSEDLGQLSAIAFNMKLRYEQFISGIFGSNDFTDVFGEDGANFKMRCMLLDTDDNCVIQDFTIFFNDLWQSISLPIGGFEIFKAREPRYNSNTEYFFFQPKGIDVQNIFVWRNLKSISFYTLTPYDDFGRYAPGLSSFTSWGALNETKRMSLTIDGLRFVKPLFVSTGKVDTDVIQSEFLEKPEISNYEQLLSDATAEQQKQLHQHIEYDVGTTGRFDVGFGDYFNLSDSEIIPAFTNPSSSAGTVKLVAKRIEYSITKPVNGAGGFLRRIKGIRRFV